MTTREALEAMPIEELHDRTMKVARHRLDVGFLWDLVKALPVAEEVAGDDQRSKVDIMRPLALLNDLVRDTDEGAVGRGPSSDVRGLPPRARRRLGRIRRLSANSSPTGTSSRCSPASAT